MKKYLQGFPIGAMILLVAGCGGSSDGSQEDGSATVNATMMVTSPVVLVEDPVVVPHPATPTIEQSNKENKHEHVRDHPQPTKHPS